MPPAPRKDTKLRKRGEDDDDSKYIGMTQFLNCFFRKKFALLVPLLRNIRGNIFKLFKCLSIDLSMLKFGWFLRIFVQLLSIAIVWS